MAPPLARGSTPLRGLTGRPRPGSPARAGIDPRSPGPPRRRARLPRSRGDRPERCDRSRRRSGAPPLARGSTRALELVAERLWGSPARAGIDPRLRGDGSGGPGLPRSRGDRPHRAHRPASDAEAPPLARGSTRPANGGPARCGGSPARAGIDPDPVAGTFDDARLPRSRGDRPARFIRIGARVPAPPLARGSTRCDLRHRHLHGGSPARAGIDRSRRPGGRGA